jgi:cytochrome d ubiquinol oxidase subunit I
MDVTALVLSRIQFGSAIAFHIIFSSLTIGLAAWLTVLEALHLWTGRLVYRWFSNSVLRLSVSSSDSALSSQ